MTMTRRDFLSASAALAAAPALRRARMGRAAAARGRHCRDRRGRRRHRRGAAHHGGEPQGHRGGGRQPDRRPLPHRHRDIRRAVRSRRALDAQSRHQPDDQARARRGARRLRGAVGQKIRIGRRNARAGETEEFLAALVRANRAIDDASRGKADVSCASALPKDLGDWAGTAEFVLGANAAGKDLKDLSAIDKARAQDRNAAIACRQGLGTLIAKLGEQVPLSLSTPASRIGWSNRDVTVETPAGKIAARAAVVTVSSNVLAAGNIKFTPDIPEAPARCRGETRPRQLSIASRCSCRAIRSGWRATTSSSSRAIRRAPRCCSPISGIVAVLDRCRRLVRPRSLGAGRKGHGGLCGGMADQTVRQRGRVSRQEIERDALERGAVRARRDVGGGAGRAAVAKNPDRADRLHVPRRRSDPRNAVGHGRRRLGKRRARGGSGAAQDRRAPGGTACRRRRRKQRRVKVG